MFHIVYVSTATRPFTDLDAEEVLQDARERNEALGVTGLLVHTAVGGFLQILEGEHSAVEQAFERAAASQRHAGILRTPTFPVPARVFPEWSMGYERALPGQLVEQVLQPLVDHQLIDSSGVRAILLERWGMKATLLTAP